MIAQSKSLEDLTRQAMDVLRRELGVTNTLRFLRQFRSGTGNYTEDREDIPIEEIFAEARRLREAEASR